MNYKVVVYELGAIEGNTPREDSIYEQYVEKLDIRKLIAVVNGLEDKHESQ